jgi:hypothetical protein
LDSSRRAAILEAALEGLAERGYDLLTMDEIRAQRATEILKARPGVAVDGHQRQIPDGPPCRSGRA